MAKKIVCPNRKCKSANVVPIVTEKRISLSKGIIGGALLGPMGAAVGALSGTRGKTKFHCPDCGTVFEAKV